MATHNGYDVAEIQRLLNAAGYSPPLAVDGSYGPKTQAAVRWYQQSHGLAVDGDVGPKTWSAMHAQGGATGGQTAGQPAGQAAPQQTAAQLYPQYQWALNHPELGPILNKAASEGWDSARLQGAIYGTSWWKSNAEPMRRWELLKNTDPATAQRTFQGALASVTDLAKSMGVNVGPLALQELANNQIQLGWSDAELRDQLAKWYGLDAGPLTGTAASVKQMIGQLTRDYGVAVPDQWVLDVTRGILAGDVDEAHIRQAILEAAKGKFPGIAKQLDGGMTVTQLAGPYIQQAANELGISADQIDLMDPKWNLFFNQSDGKGGIQMMTLYDWQKHYRNAPEYGFNESPTATGMAASTILDLERRWGFAS